MPRVPSNKLEKFYGKKHPSFDFHLIGGSNITNGLDLIDLKTNRTLN